MNKVSVSAGLGLLFAASSVLAQEACDWAPTRAVTYLVPYAAGGGTDAHSRQMASMLEARFGQPFNVVNRPGGNAVGGYTAIARAKADGYTLGAVSSEINTLHWVGLTDLTYEDYTPLGLIDVVPASVLVADDSPFDTLESLLDHARDNPGALTASGTSLGGAWHLALAGMLNAEGIAPDAIRWIPSQGSAPALQELIAGGVDVVTPSLAEGRGLIAAGDVRALAYMYDEPSASFPDVPATSEALDSGWTYAAYITTSTPAGLDENIACTYANAIAEILASDEWAQFKQARGSLLVSMAREELVQYMADVDTAMGETIRAVGLASE